MMPAQSTAAAEETLHSQGAEGATCPETLRQKDGGR